MRATMLLADAAQAIDGKLYVLGGGWNMMGVGSPSALAIHIHVPWDLTNRRHRWRLELLDADGQLVVVPGPPQREIAMEGQFEVGRPAGIPAGADMGVSIAVNVGVLPLAAGGRYEWRLWLNGETDENWRLPFSVIAVPPSAAGRSASG